MHPQVIAAAKDVCRDCIGVMLAGGVEHSGVAERIKVYTRSLGGEPQCSVVTGGFRTNPLNAAFANGVMAHVLDYEPMMYPLTHPTSPVLPPLLALAEAEGHSGAAVLMALIVGFEVQALLRRVGLGMELYRFHPPGIVGPFGAAAACARLLGLSPQQTAWALGIAGSRASGLTANTGTMTKSTHPAHAGRMGLEAAVLARLGWTAHEDVLDAGRFAAYYFGTYDFAPLRGYGNPWFLHTPGVMIKKFPSQTYTHRAIDAALELRRRYELDPGSIERVEIESTNRSVVDRPRPRDGLEGKFSIQYATAVALLDGQVTIDSFSDARRFAPDVEALLPRVTFIPRREISDDVLAMYSVVTVTTRDGRTLSVRCDRARGMWGAPLTREEMVAKFTDCASRALPPDGVARALELIDTLDQQPDVRALMALLREAHGP
jgi:aconitate decarboxylase